MNPKALALAMLSLSALPAWASDTPLSGTFSNLKNTARSGYAESMKNKINLIVTLGPGGQQFFIQCFKGDKPGFGVTPGLKSPQREAKIKACPSNS